MILICIVGRDWVQITYFPLYLVETYHSPSSSPYTHTALNIMIISRKHFPLFQGNGARRRRRLLLTPHTQTPLPSPSLSIYLSISTCLSVYLTYPDLECNFFTYIQHATLFNSQWILTKMWSFKSLRLPSVIYLMKSNSY